MACLSEESRGILEHSGLTLGLASLVAIAGGALALGAGARVQVLQTVMTWMSLPWFAACCLFSRWWSRHRLKTQEEPGGNLEASPP